MPNSLRVFWGYGCLIQKLLLLLVAWSCPTLCDPMDCSMPGFPVLHRLPELAQTHVHWVGDANDRPMISSSLTPCSHLQSFPASGSFQMSQFFASGGQNIGVSALASVLPMNIQDWFPLGFDWMDLLAVKGTLKSLLQHHSSEAWIRWCSALFIVQLSHLYMTTGENIALSRRTFVGKVMFLLFNRQSRLVIAFLPRSSIF